MTTVSNDFYVTLNSNASQKIYKSNKLSTFKVKLSHQVGLGSDANWEVGFCEISCLS